MTEIIIDNISISSENLCSICWANMENIYNTECKHSFHKICIDKWLENNITCPICRTVIKKINPSNVSNNIVVPINIPRQIEVREHNQRNQRNQANHANQQNVPIIENKTFLKLFVISYIFINIYNIIMLFLSSNYIDDYYNDKLIKDPTIFLIVDVFLMLLLPPSIIKKIHSTCAYFIFIIFYIMLIVCYVYYYKEIYNYFNILSLGIKINLAISSGLHILFNIAYLTITNYLQYELARFF